MIVRGDWFKKCLQCDRCKARSPAFAVECIDQAIEEGLTGFHATSDGHHYCPKCVDAMIAESKTLKRKKGAKK